jgi:Protein of unknown function (DUF998)
MTDSTRLLLRAGAVIAPWFLGLSIIQALANPGFDLTKHEVSLLLAGPAGWVQTITFVVTGALGIAYSIGVRRLLHPGRAGTWGPILLGAFGVLFVIAGLFPPDPKLGFPLGAPEGVPVVQSVSSNLHSLAFSALAVVTIAACFVLARRFRTDGARGWANFSIVAAVAIIVCVAAGSALMSTGYAGLALLGAAVAITGWVSAAAFHLLRARRLVAAGARDGAQSASR